MEAKQTSRDFVLFGVDSCFSPEVMETLQRLGFTVAAGVITGAPEWDYQGVERLLNESDIDRQLLSHPVIVPWVTPTLRFARTARAQAAGFTRFESVVDPTAVIASTAKIAEGVFVNAGAVVGAHVALGEGTILNRNASVGHHTILEEFVSMGPGAVIASKCTIGRGTMIGAGAAVAPELRVGRNSVVGLGAAVIRDVPSNTMVVGNPARMVKLDLPDLDCRGR